MKQTTLVSRISSQIPRIILLSYVLQYKFSPTAFIKELLKSYRFLKKNKELLKSFSQVKSEIIAHGIEDLIPRMEYF